MHFCKIRGSSKWHRKQTLQYICMKFSGCILLNIVSVCIISVFFKAGTPVHCTVFPTCVYRLSPLESKIFAANKLRLWT